MLPVCLKLNPGQRSIWPQKRQANDFSQMPSKVTGTFPAWMGTHSVRQPGACHWPAAYRLGFQPQDYDWSSVSLGTLSTHSLRSQLYGINWISWWVWFIIFQKERGEMAQNTPRAWCIRPRPRGGKLQFILRIMMVTDCVCAICRSSTQLPRKKKCLWTFLSFYYSSFQEGAT